MSNNTSNGPAGDTLARLRAFAQAVLSGYLGGGDEIGDIDGATLQALGKRHGLLEPTTRTAICGEGCACADVAEGDEWICFKPTDVLTGAASPAPDALLSAPAPAVPETAKDGCISCGDVGQGGYEVEDVPGPFCETCWEKLGEHFYQTQGHPAQPLPASAEALSGLLNVLHSDMMNWLDRIDLRERGEEGGSHMNCDAYTGQINKLESAIRLLTSPGEGRATTADACKWCRGFGSAWSGQHWVPCLYCKPSAAPVAAPPQETK